MMNARKNAIFIGLSDPLWNTAGSHLWSSNREMRGESHVKEMPTSVHSLATYGVPYSSHSFGCSLGRGKPSTLFEVQGFHPTQRMLISPG